MCNTSNINIETEHVHKYPTRFASLNIPKPMVRTTYYGLNSLKYNLITAYNNIPSEMKNLCPGRYRLLKRKLKDCIWLGLENTP